MMALEGGSFGLQLGGQATDFVLLVMNQRRADSILSSKVKLGAGVSAAADPKGREASAATDAALRAKVLSYSRSPSDCLRECISKALRFGRTMMPTNGSMGARFRRKRSFWRKSKPATGSIGNCYPYWTSDHRRIYQRRQIKNQVSPGSRQYNHRSACHDRTDDSIHQSIPVLA